MKDYRDKKIAVVGLGEENVALVRYLVGRGAKVTVCDRKGREELWDYIKKIEDLDVDFLLGSRYLDSLNKFEVIFRTPGLPYLNLKIQKAIRAGIEVTSEIKLFFEECPSPIIGVTGTKGKGTTVSLIEKILKLKSEVGGPKAIYLGGNIGNPPIEFLEKLTADDLVILELSSFQLQDLNTSPHVAVVLNIASDHLDYHQDHKEYVVSKKNIVKFQKEEDFAVICADYEVSSSFSLFTKAKVYWFSRFRRLERGIYKEGNKLVLKDGSRIVPIIDKNEILLRGEHNLENIAAAAMASYLLGAEVGDISEAIKNFRGLEHRLEFIGEKSGIKFYNDSFATTPETAIAAVKAFSEPVILIAGGSEKNADYNELGKIIAKSSVKTAILIGVTGPKIEKAIGKHVNKIKIINHSQNLDEVFKVIKEETASGDVVLFSPASASFDWFKNYKERGRMFKEKVNENF